MTEQITKRTTITEDLVEPRIVVAEPRPVVETDYQTGRPHGDEEAGGAIGGAVAGGIVGAVVGGPVGAVIGGAIGAASGATAGALDSKIKDDTTVVTREVRRS
jgi:outer membrane lipoprotein SlyB